MNENMKVELLSHTPNPNLICYDAMHQCYSCDGVFLDRHTYENLPSEDLGRRLVKNCVSYGHWSVLEPAYFVFNAIGFPHDVIVQARTHRHLSFSVQSQRYTFKKVYTLGKILLEQRPNFPTNLIQDAFYFREVDRKYFDREGNKYIYTKEEYEEDLQEVARACQRFAIKIDKGFAPEHARQLLPQNIRQNFVMSCNARALLHLCDLRLPSNAQIEIVMFAEQVFAHFEKLMPEVAEWYRKNRYGKSKLSP
jgi:thymidylate synthase (FAD)